MGAHQYSLEEFGLESSFIDNYFQEYINQYKIGTKMLLKDKVVIISGIGPGLGQELAYGAAREGAKIAIAARSTELLNKLKDEIGKKSEVIAIPSDITKPEECKNLVDETVKKYGKLDGLINSAYRAGDFK